MSAPKRPAEEATCITASSERAESKRSVQNITDTWNRESQKANTQFKLYHCIPDFLHPQLFLSFHAEQLSLRPLPQWRERDRTAFMPNNVHGSTCIAAPISFVDCAQHATRGTDLLNTVSLEVFFFLEQLRNETTYNYPSDACRLSSFWKTCKNMLHNMYYEFCVIFLVYICAVTFLVGMYIILSLYFVPVYVVYMFFMQLFHSCCLSGQQYL